ncbi:hypothetical protein OHB24_38940 [Kribbella sp. NBC_00482]|uniref:endonuclease/exonuclease/phosphatase family protein n=1 Tax=Kribbella sp. NBC_00482 TaxID=2975968 RepID=UPI002E173AEB
MVDHQVRVMTWNIWWRFGPRWRERQPGILSTIDRVTPDVVALQEVWGAEGTTQAEQFAETLGYHSTFAAPSYPCAPDPAVIGGDAVDGVFPSDHRPVICDLRWHDR